ncbi:hypothetical protein T484DRAFT_1956713, partial [Baffinella frigidus]
MARRQAAASFLLLAALISASIRGEASAEDQVCKDGETGPHCSGGAGAGTVLALNPYGLEDFVGNHPAVVAVFCAASAGKCRLLAPEVQKAAESTATGARFVTVDAEEHPEARIIYGIEAYPTIRLFLNGRMAEEYEGKRLAGDLTAAADKLAEAAALPGGRAGGEGRASAVVEMTGSSFKAMTHDTKLNLLVLFYSPEDCGSLALEFEAVARTFEPFSNVTIARIAVQEHPETFDKYSHLGLPAIVFFGQADRYFGFKPKEVVYADLRLAGPMVRFLNRKCATREPLHRLP